MSLSERIKSALRFSGRVDTRIRDVKLNEAGSEILDSTPMEPPLGYVAQPSMFDVMRKMISDRERELSAAGFETPEEADDFDVDDDFDPSSPYEHDFDPPADLSALPSEVPPVASGTPPEPPADGPATPPAPAAPAGSPAPQGGPAKS